MGIQPDVALYPARIKEGNVRIGPRPKHRLEADLENAFGQKAEEGDQPIYEVRYLRPVEEEPEEGAPPPKSFAEMDKDQQLTELGKDFEITLARELLGAYRGAPKEAVRDGLLAALERVVGDVENKQHALVAEEIANIVKLGTQSGIDDVPDAQIEQVYRDHIEIARTRAVPE